MDRRRFVLSSTAGILGSALAQVVDATGQTLGLKASAEECGELFPAGSLSELAWSQFTAAGFTEPVCGLIYRKSKPAECGLPLGAIDTGGLDLDTDGTFGYSSIFGSFIPPRGPLRQPFLGIQVEKQTWVLATRHTEEIERVNKANEINYWGHYPVADLEYETSAPVSVGLRAWTPFIPGDVAISNTPGAVFEVRLRNQTAARKQGSLMFSFSGPTQAEAQISNTSPRERDNYNWFWVLKPVARAVMAARRKELQGELNGVSVTSDSGVGYTLAALGGEKVRLGGHLGTEGNVWKSNAPAPPQEHDFGTSLTVDFDLDPREAKTIRFVLAWYAPLWKGEGTHCFTHMYASRYPDSLAVAQLLAREHTSLLKRVLSWQQAIYTQEKLPVWLR
jgi:hypothetical protein